uniref:Uncharacterized protein n=1 Tax=Timema tahoe TaxID=61484 RepID=A0A7R9I9B3_9NEOP|nr:unnamed protein product [Timema tahoe]
MTPPSRALSINAPVLTSSAWVCF